MSILVTGSAGHLGEALIRTFAANGQSAVGLDLLPSPFTNYVGSITNRGFVRQSLNGIQTVIHAATLHKPHVATNTRQEFVDTNITGTLNLLEESVAAGVQQFIFTSTTSTFGFALTPSPEEPAAWITEDVMPIPKNIYGVTKVAAENLCELFYRKHKLPVIILRTSRFFPEEDDNPAVRENYSRDNAQANELLYRRADIQDIVSAHLAAVAKAKDIGFGRYIISATTPFSQSHLKELRNNAPAVVHELFQQCEALYSAKAWKLFPRIGRVYVNQLAINELGWRPKYNFAHVLQCLEAGTDFRSPLAKAIGSKGYHDTIFEDGPYPVS